MMYSACASSVIPGFSQRLFRPRISNAGIGASSDGIDQELLLQKYHPCSLYPAETVTQWEKV